jgi:hypothetical protein
MVTLRSLANQELEIILNAEGKVIHYCLLPKASVTVPKSFITDVVTELTRRRLLSLKTIK